MVNSLRLAVNTSIYDGYDTEMVFASIKKCGFKFFELAYNQGYVGNLNSSLFSNENADKINKLKEKYGLSTVALGCTMDLSTDGLADIFAERLRFAQKIGVTYINVCTTKMENKAKLVTNLKSLRPLLQETGSILCLENGGDYNYNAFVTVKDGVELLNKLGTDHYAFNFDPGNMVTIDNSLDVVGESLASLDYCQHFHVKDVAILNEKFRFIPINGTGLINYANIVPQLKVRNLPFSVEIPLRIYRDFDSTPRRFDDIVTLEEIEKTLMASRKYIESL